MASVFRSAAHHAASRFSGIVAASLVAASYAVAPVPAAARDIEGLPAQCANVGDELAKLKCGRRVFQARTADAQARSADAQARSADAQARSADAQARGTEAKKRAAFSDNENACLDLIMNDLKANGPKTASLTEPPQKGAACKLAKTLRLTAG